MRLIPWCMFCKCWRGGTSNSLSLSIHASCRAAYVRWSCKRTRRTHIFESVLAYTPGRTIDRSQTRLRGIRRPRVCIQYFRCLPSIWSCFMIYVPRKKAHTTSCATTECSWNWKCIKIYGDYTLRLTLACCTRMHTKYFLTHICIYPNICRS